MILPIILSVSAHAESIEGTVLEVGLGSPATGVTISFGQKSTRSDSSGRFIIEVDDLQTVIYFTSPHFRDFQISADQLVKRKIIWLRPKVAPVEIIVEERGGDPNAFVRSLDREQVERTPGTHDDPIRLLQSLSGVATTREYTPSGGDILLRSAAPQDSRILVDGVELPYLFHFQQYASVIHTRLLDSVNVYPSGYGTMYGDAIGGIVSVNTRMADSIKPRGAVNLNMIMAGTYATVPIGDGVYSFSGRRSYADLFTDSNDQYTAWPAFWDYLSRYDWQVNNERTISFSALGARDSYGRFVFDTERLDPYEQSENPAFIFDRMFHSLSIRWDERQQSRRMNSVFAIVTDRWNGSLLNSSQEREDTYAWIRNESRFLLNDFVELSTGFAGKLGRVNLLCNCTDSYPILRNEAPLLAQGQDVSEELTEDRLGVWLEPRFTLGEWVIAPGVRWQTALQNGYRELDPRVSVTYQGRGFDFRFAGGVYHQIPSIDLLRLDSTLPTAGALQGATGISTVAFDSLEIGVDLWGRSYENASRLGPNSDLQEYQGWAIGTELQAKFRLKERFFSWASVSVMQATENQGVGVYEQPVSVQFLMSWRPFSDWDFGLRYRYASGMPFFQPVSSLYMSALDTYTPVFSETPNDRLPDYQKIDLHVAKKWWFEHWELTTYMELWYVPSSANYLYEIYNFDYTDSQLVIGPPFVPLIGARIER